MKTLILEWLEIALPFAMVATLVFLHGTYGVTIESMLYSLEGAIQWHKHTQVHRHYKRRASDGRKRVSL